MSESETLQVPNGDEIEGFDQDFINQVKTGFKPLFVRNPLTTVYQALPYAIYNVKPAAYIPRSCTIGLSWGTQLLLNNSLDSIHCSAHMASIVSRNPSITFENYLAAMNGLRHKIEACHLLPLKVDLTNLIILVMSCAQIIDILLLFHEGRLTSEVDRVCTSELQTLWLDLLLVKNQVPFFALQKMYDMLISGTHHNMAPAQQFPSLVDLSLHFFEQFLDLNKDLAPPLESNSINHLLHLVHYYLLPQNNPPPFPPSSKKPSHHIRLITESIPSARRLKEVGVRFQKKSHPGFSNITFYKGVLQLPFLSIDNNTEILLRNMALWEQCHFNVGGYFTSYCIFMDYLVNAAEDVHILQNEGIIEQLLGSEEQVASLFNGLSINIAYIDYENDFLPDLSCELNTYCGNKFNLWKAKLLMDYFSSPWAIVSVIAAIFLLLMTATQTFYSGYAYYRPN